jgi:hypothetical protein
MGPLEMVGRLIVCTVDWGEWGGWGCRRGGEQLEIYALVLSTVSAAVQHPVTGISQSLGIAAGVVRVRRILYSQEFAIERKWCPPTWGSCGTCMARIGFLFHLH